MGQAPAGAGSPLFSMPVAVAGGQDAISVRRHRQGRHRPAGRCCRRSGPQRWANGDPHHPGQGRAARRPPPGRPRSRALPRRPRRGDPLYRVARVAQGAVSGDRGARRRLCSGALTRARPAAVGRPSRSSIRLMGTLAPVPGIRGRAAEIAVLGDAVDRVVSGRPAVVLIEGEAGIGKTRLLAGVLEDARGRGMQVAVGRAEELERTRPFGLVATAFGCVRSSPDPRRAAIAALLATRGDDRGPITVTSDPGLRFRAVDAFADLAEELALAGPLVIGVDDLQWADPSSLLTLAAVSRRLAHLPVALIGCLRPSPRIPELDRLAGLLLDAGGRILAVRGLTERAVAELVAEAVAAVPGPGLLAGISGAAGNPLFVTELLGALAQEGAIETAGGRAEVAKVTLPPTLRLTILRRLSFLSEDTLQALRAASILGSSFTVTELSVTMARPALELSVVLAEGIAGRVLEEYGAVIRFRHDLIRDAIYEDLPLSVRRGLHREAGQRLAQTGAPALQVAEH